MISPSAVLARRVGAHLIGAASARWPAQSRLFLVGESAPWVIAREMTEVAQIARRLGIRLGNPRLASHVRAQSVFYGGQFVLLSGRRLDARNRLGLAYFHGRPGTPGSPEFDRCYRSLVESQAVIERVQVSHTEMREVVLSSGIDPAKVFTIPIGINLAEFPLRDEGARLEARARYGIPDSAVVVGSIQKDGVGWAEGDEPKLIKGPDVFVEAVGRLRERVPELFVLLGGPSRGFVKRGLEELGVPYRHVIPGADFDEVARLYRALDLYLVASRQEGGPKAVFESWASGVPLVTTRVGQAMDLVAHGSNGWMVDVEDVDGIVHWAEHALTHSAESQEVALRARADVEAHSYEAQAPLWREMFHDFVAISR
jgi:glycosyltransferase involved in cell wall biosynthesis